MRDVGLPVLAKVDVGAELTLEAWGWFPIGQGEISVTVPDHRPDGKPLQGLTILGVDPFAASLVVPRLPPLSAEIAERTAERALRIISAPAIEIRSVKVDAACTGAGLLLRANNANVTSGFPTLGTKGKPEEMVAAEASAAFLAYDRRRGAFDQHLADQLLLPLNLADKLSCLTTERRTLHLETNAWVIEAFGQAELRIDVVGRYPGYRRAGFERRPSNSARLRSICPA